jgi:uridine kinase
VTAEAAVVVTIAGPSASGKSTLAGLLAAELGELAPAILRQDDYFRDFAEFDEAERERVRTANHPSAVLWESFHEALDTLTAGGRVLQPAPGTRGRSRGLRERWLGPGRLIIVEGLFALWDERSRDRADLRVYLEVDEDERVLRRLHRDIAERGGTLERSVAWYRRDVAPNYPLYTAPSRQYADLVVPTNHAVDVAVSALREAIRGIAAARLGAHTDRVAGDDGR